MMTTGISFAYHSADFRNGDLEIREQFEQVRFKFLVAAVKLVDQQYRRFGIGCIDGL